MGMGVVSGGDDERLGFYVGLAELLGLARATPATLRRMSVE